jgi:hypothetical protein
MILAKAILTGPGGRGLARRRRWIRYATGYDTRLRSGSRAELAKLDRMAATAHICVTMPPCYGKTTAERPCGG